MRLFSLAFLLGVLLLQQFSYLPDKKFVWLLTCIIPFLYFKYARPIIAFVLGFAWALWFAHHQMSWTLSSELEGKPVIITGRVASIPENSLLGTNFLFSLKKFQNLPTHTLIHLTCHDNTQKILPGDEWQFTARLKKIHGTLNPGGFDYEAWALEQGIRANGYIQPHSQNILISSHWYSEPINRVRFYLKEKIENNLPLSNTSPWIEALILGERHDIAQSNWQILRNTGTNHLMAIAGLHIGLIAGFIFVIVSWCWRRIASLTLKIPAQIAASFASLLVAIFYSALAGFSLPTQRACMMLMIFLFFVFLKRKNISWHAWSFAMLGVLLLNPLSVLSESFWLSFGSVALIIYGMSGRLGKKNLWWKWGRIQWVIAVGLIPLSVWLFQQVSFVSFIANSIAIPWVGFLVLPLSIIGAVTLFFSDKTGGIILQFADQLLSILWKLLTWLSQLSFAEWHQFIPNHFILISACLGMIILLLPKSFPGRWFGLIGLAPLFLYHPSSPKQGDAWLSVLDVGQGLASVVQTKNHILVFDAGPKFGVNFDMGDSVVSPFLHTIGTKKIDMLVVSHGDNDHIGGANAVLNQFSISKIKTSVPEKFPQKNVEYCFRGQQWTWDGVQFEFLYPTSEYLNLNNDSSCVLKINTQSKTILLTGDIQKVAEKYLIQTSTELKSDIVVAPHHGSKTSAQDDFLQAVNPSIVIFSTGYRNRYHFPNKDVVAKYQLLNSSQFITAKSGAIEFKPDTFLYRNKISKYWNYS
jgi:competence protein ComEC